MATNSPSPFGRQNTTQQTNYLSRRIAFSDGTGVLSVGWLPAGAAVINAGVVVGEAFDAGSGNTLDIGTADDPDSYASAISVAAAGRILADELASSADVGPLATNTEVVCQMTLGGSAPTAGDALVFVEFIPANEE